MKKLIFTALLILPAVFAAFAQEVATVSYLDGWVDIKDSSGLVSEAYIGDPLMAGNSVITGKNSLAELLEKSGSTYRISSETVFTVREMEDKGKKQSVLSVTLGEVAFKFRRAASEEPLIATNSTVAGVRGTDFTVYSGADGSTLIAVENGMVEVEAAGKSVELVKDEAVEVRPGEPPGQKFSFIGRELDFSSWNAEKKQTFLDNPADALKGVEKRLDYYNEKINELYPVFLEWKDQLFKEQKEFEKLLSEKGPDKAIEYRDREMASTMRNYSVLVLNIRYHALSALSMRRFIVGNMYGEIKSRFITKLDDSVYRDFIKTYNELLEKFEKMTVPQLNETDI